MSREGTSPKRKTTPLSASSVFMGIGNNHRHIFPLSYDIIVWSVWVWGRVRCRWAYIATQLRGRSDNAIKNRWNNYLKKKPAISTLQNISDTQLFHLNQNIPNASSIPTPISALQEIANPWFISDEANQEFLRGDEIIHHSLIAGFTSFIPNVNPNETNFGGDYFEPWISGPASASVEYALMPTERITRNWSPLFEAWPELTD